jgi:hypothetical protein
MQRTPSRFFPFECRPVCHVCLGPEITSVDQWQAGYVCVCTVCFMFWVPHLESLQRDNKCQPTRLIATVNSAGIEKVEAL